VVLPRRKAAKASALYSRMIEKKRLETMFLLVLFMVKFQSGFAWNLHQPFLMKKNIDLRSEATLTSRRLVALTARRYISRSASEADEAEPEQEEQPMIKVGDFLPLDLVVQVLDPECTSADKNVKVPFSDFFVGRKIVLVTVPGAFTPNSSTKHLPAYIEKADEFKEKGVDEIVVISVNDPFVLAAWSKDLGAAGKVTFVADGAGAVADALGLTIDTGCWGGKRMIRSSMLVDDGVLKEFNVEEAGGFTELSGAAFLLGHIHGQKAKAKEPDTEQSD